LSSSTADDSSWYSSAIPFPLERRYREGKRSFSPSKQAQILQDFKIPAVKDVFAFALPAVFVWLCVPLLTLIDTSLLGLMAGTAQQAALNPALAVINYSSKLVVSNLLLE
jgi:hypothetical protein